MNSDLPEIAIYAYPLSKGHETGRGLERVIEEFILHLEKSGYKFNFLDSGHIKNEFVAVLKSVLFLLKIYSLKAKCSFAIYPVAAIYPIILNKKNLTVAIHDLIPFQVYGYDNFLKYFIKRICIKYSIMNSDKIIVPFQSTKVEIVNRFKINEDRIFVIPYGVNHSVYYPDVNIVKDNFSVSFLGEAKKAKGMDTVIRAFRLVLKEVPSAKLSLASSGRELNEMIALAKQLLPPDSYRFLGFIPESNMRNFYCSTKVFVFPSRYGFGLSALEAMACGTPAIISKTLDATDFLNDPDLVIDPEDYKTFAHRIIELLTNHSFYEQKSSQAIEISKQFSWTKMSEKWCEIILASR